MTTRRRCRSASRCNFIWVLVWSLAGFVALVAGIMWGAKSGVQFSLSLIALKALPVLMLGGFTSIPGAIVGGLIIGVGEKLFEFCHRPDARRRHRKLVRLCAGAGLPACSGRRACSARRSSRGCMSVHDDRLIGFGLGTCVTRARAVTFIAGAPAE